MPLRLFDIATRDGGKIYFVKAIDVASGSLIIRVPAAPQ